MIIANNSSVAKWAGHFAMFTFKETGNIVVMTYQTGEGDLFRSFAICVSEITSPFRVDFLLDLRGLTGPLDLSSSKDLGRRWAELSRGKDVGRRTAIVSSDPAIRGQVDVFRQIYPFRSISVFDDYFEAEQWISNVSNDQNDSFQFI